MYVPPSSFQDIIFLRIFRQMQIDTHPRFRHSHTIEHPYFIFNS